MMMLMAACNNASDGRQSDDSTLMDSNRDKDRTNVDSNYINSGSGSIDDTMSQERMRNKLTEDSAN